MRSCCRYAFRLDEGAVDPVVYGHLVRDGAEVRCQRAPLNRLKRILGLGGHETAWPLLNPLRRVMIRPERDCLVGTVAVGETSVEGEARGVRAARQSPKPASRRWVAPGGRFRQTLAAWHASRGDPARAFGRTSMGIRFASHQPPPATGYQRPGSGHAKGCVGPCRRSSMPPGGAYDGNTPLPSGTSAKGSFFCGDHDTVGNSSAEPTETRR